MIAAGQSIGNYRILNKIGTGGMGAVYVAEHPLIGKKVALKVIHRELAGNKEVVARFYQEAKAVNKIGNEHIVEIHDFGQTPEGDHFYIMEYLEGKTLASELARQKTMDILRALHIGAQVASALAAAHAAGIIHRDLKPDNVMLTNRLGDPDFVKLLDFGLAKMFTGGQGAVKTAAGILLGTPQYMSPEACESKPNLDHRTDIYALGVLLFQMMAGALPFDGETMGEVLVKQVTQLPPPPRGLNPQIPPSVEQILLRCLMKSPDQRFPTMMTLRDALLDPERYLANRPPIAPARSIPPGEARGDAKTVMAYAADPQRTALSIPPPDPRGKGGRVPSALPLPAPATTMPGRAGAGPSAPPPIGAMVVLGDAHHAGPDLAVPAAPKSHTMRIATPLGYSSRPPRKMWPIVLVLGLLLGLGGGAFAVAWFGRGGKQAAAAAMDAPERAPGSGLRASGSGSATGTGTATATATGSATATATATATASGSATGSGSDRSPKPEVRSPTISLATVEIDSDPQGAEILVGGKSLGKTPAKLQMPISDLPVTFDLKLPGYRKKTKQLVINGNQIISIPLDRAPAQTPSTGHKQPEQKDTGLMRPDDL